MKFIQYVKRALSPIACTLCDKGEITLCAQCLETLPKIKQLVDGEVYVLLSYRDIKVKKILRDAKYHHHKMLYEPLIVKLVETTPFLLTFNPKETLIIPLPTHPLRSLFRGQDHTKALASFLAKEIGLPYTTSLLKKKNLTKRQALLTKSNRLSAQKNSFSVPESKQHLLSGKNILLIDDIVTTGSTLSEAKRVLLAAGAMNVYLFALAH